MFLDADKISLHLFYTCIHINGYVLTVYNCSQIFKIYINFKKSRLQLLP